MSKIIFYITLSAFIQQLESAESVVEKGSLDFTFESSKHLREFRGVGGADRKSWIYALGFPLNPIEEDIWVYCVGKRKPLKTWKDVDVEASAL